MSDKRSVATDALETLGTLIDDQQKRDAIHLAVEPVIAGEGMEPGDHITVKDGIALRADPGDEDPPLGIVDPFLSRRVRKGQRFWFVMYPRTIKSLRHVWAHPAFPDEPVVGGPVAELEDVPPAIQTLRTKQAKATSEKWLRDFIDRSDCPSYERVMAAVSDGDFDEDSIHFDGADAHGEIPTEFWDHAEVVLGRKLEQRPTYFSCSC